MSIDNNSAPPHGEEKAVADSEESRLEARRNFLKKAGKFALYTPPALSLLMYPSMQAIAKSGGGGYGGGTSSGRGRGRGFGRGGRRGDFRARFASRFARITGRRK